MTNATRPPPSTSAEYVFNLLSQEPPEKNIELAAEQLREAHQLLVDAHAYDGEAALSSIAEALLLVLTAYRQLRSGK